MENALHLYNSLNREKQKFEPINAPNVGMYVCGPTVYGEPHLGHARAAVTFDILFRYLKYLDYKVRYVRNITDVGHLEDDASDEGEDKVAKKARLEKIEPMEVVQHYTLKYHEAMDLLNTLPPSIEPQASGHIMDQIDIVKKILDNGLAYEIDGSVYFDVKKYAGSNDYGKLSGKVLEDLLAGSRNLAGQDEKRSSVDFALWKKAAPEHIMKWESPWSTGFPGWHLECTAMSTKYLGSHFDIHGGGMDLQFPHHEAEIAQNKSSCGESPCNYWLHNNMLTINGQKMGKSLGNFINLSQLFSGEHDLLEQAYDPMVVRFFMLQAHYRSTLDFSNEALQAAEKGLKKLVNAKSALNSLEAGKESNWNLSEWIGNCRSHMNDDLNTPRLIAELFEAATVINKLKSGDLNLSENDLREFRQHFNEFTSDVLGLHLQEEDKSVEKLDEVMQLLLELRQEARKNKDFDTADKIRDRLSEAGIMVKDGKDGAEWEAK